MTRLIYIGILTLCLQSCKKETATETQEDPEQPILTGKEVFEKKRNAETWDVLAIEEIDSAEYYAERAKTPPLPEKYQAITDRKIVSQLLKGIVTLGYYEGATEKLVASDTGWVVMDIRPRRGGRVSDYDRDESVFMAYYPELDILLCEGGHTTEMTYNLTTGETRETTGSPETFVTAPDKSMRFSGVFDGQECFSYYIHRNEGGAYKKVITLDEVFDKRMANFALCRVSDAFWGDSTTLYLLNPEGYMDNNFKRVYFRVKLGRL